MSAPPPNQRGNGVANSAATAISTRLKAKPKIYPCRITARAFSKSLAPMKCAACTEKPIPPAATNEPKSQVAGSTKPIEAEAAAPNEPTIEASM